LGYGDDSGVEHQQGYKLLRECDLAIVYSTDVVFKLDMPMEKLRDSEQESYEELWSRNSENDYQALDEAIESGHIVTRRRVQHRLPLSEESQVESFSDYQPDTTDATESTDEDEPEESSIDPLVMLARLTELPLQDIKDPNFYQCFNAAMHSGCPQSYQEAISGPERKQWKEAMDREMKSIQQAKTWIVKKPYHSLKKSPVKNRWVFTKKFDKNGEVKKFKARLVAKGFTQKYGIDYNETFAPVAKFKSIRLLAAISAKTGMQAYQDDVPTAFLKGTLQEEIWMEQPEGYVKGSPGELCLLTKTLYGLKQSPREWNAVIHQFLIEHNFIQSKADPCIYVNLSESGPLFVGVYVDDIVTIGRKEQANNFREKLRSYFGITEGGKLEWYLGVAFEYLKDGSISLNQKVYLQQKMEEFKEIVGRTRHSSPLPKDYQKLLEEENATVVTHDKFPYRKIVGSLMYAMLGTRPDLAAAVSVVSRYLDKPKPIHIQLVTRILQYVNSTLDMCLIYKATGGYELTGYVDASYAGESGYKSRSGHAFLLGGSLISWYSGMQSVVAQSSAESEYYAACAAANEALWLKQLLEDLGYRSKTLTLYEDNKACIALTKNPEDHKRTKHIQVKYHVIRDYVAKKLISFSYCPTASQLADIFTKGVPGHLLRTHLKRLGLQSQRES
jgi:hypothetical protein